MSDSRRRSQSPNQKTEETPAAETRRPRRRRRSRRRSPRSDVVTEAKVAAPEETVEETAVVLAEETVVTEAVEAPGVPDEVTAEATRIGEDATTAHHQVEEQSRRQARPSPALLELVGERLAGSEGIIVFRRPETSPCSRFRLKECFE